MTRGARGLAILAPCTSRTTPADNAGRDAELASAPTAGGGNADAGPDRRGLRGFRIAHVFDITQTEGDPLPEVAPQLLTGDAPTALWDALAAQVAAHGYTLSRGDCGDANGMTDPAARTVRVRPDVDPAQAVKTVAHELGHLDAELCASCPRRSADDRAGLLARAAPDFHPLNSDRAALRRQAEQGV